MGDYRFIIFTALRYLKARRKSRGFASSVLSILGIAVGIMVLTTVIGVMNGFQHNYINNLLEISSYHVQIIARQAKILPPAALEEIRELDGVTSVVPFREFQVMIDRAAENSETMYGVVRAVDFQAALDDESFIRHLFGEKYSSDELDRMKADFLAVKPDSVMVGYLLAYYASIQRQSEVVISSVHDLVAKAGAVDESDASSRYFTVATIFKSGYKDIDQNYIFMPLESSAAFISPDAPRDEFPLHYGIKLRDRFQDLAVQARIQALLEPAHYEVMTWRDYNKSYFGALLMEKLVMMMLVGLIFIVVGFNIYNSLRRIVFEKIEEIALLKAVGASPRSIRLIFIIEGFLIGVSGASIGLFLGLFFATHINGVFGFFTDAVNAILRFAEQLLFPLGVTADFGIMESPFSPRVFYFREVPSVVILEEAVFMFLFAVLSAVGAAFLASRKISGIKPAEVLRYE